MIGFAYLARARSSADHGRLYCIKRMIGNLVSEKGLFDALRRELEILCQVQGLSGCVQLVDVLADEESLGLVSPFYPAGDLSKYMRTVAPKSRTLPEKVAQVLFIQLIKIF